MKRGVFVFLSLIIWACGGKEPTPEYNIITEVTPTGSGTVGTPLGPFESGRPVVLLAIPESEYLFKSWSGDASGTTNPTTVVMNNNKKIIAHFEKKTYSLEVQTQGEGTVREEIVRNARIEGYYPSGTRVRLTAQPANRWIFSKWEGDLTGTENPVELTVGKPAKVRAVFQEDRPKGLILDNAKRNLYLSEEYKVRVRVIYESGKEEIIDGSELAVKDIGGKGKIVVQGDTVRAVAAGGTGITVTFKDLTETFLFTVQPIEEVTSIDPFLATPASGASLVVPVVVINYLPTADGVNLDMSRAPDDYWQLQYSTLEEAKKRIEGELKITKFGIEEGTRFRQFNATQRVNPYVGIKVVKYFNVYDLKLTDWPGNGTVKTVDYHDLFPRLGMEDLVDHQGVKEVWITMFNKDKFPSVLNSPFNDPSTYYGIPESNMSSPFTGDISNSHRNQIDLPIYKSTYVVYGNSAHRGADTNLHNRGHQIEAQLNYIEETYGKTTPGNRLFWNYFVGVDPKLGVNIPLGRAGMTHFPPNTTKDYDYDNATLVKSDIRTWDPAGGIFVPTNSNLWKLVMYDFDLISRFYRKGKMSWTNYNSHPEFKWLLFWWQSIPGAGHQISYKGSPLTNWWHVFYNWDEVVKASEGLVKQPVVQARLQVSAEGGFPVCTHNHLPTPARN